MALISINPSHVNRDIIPQNPLDRLKPLRDNTSRRRNTFNKYPKNSAVSAESLISDGFYYVGDGHNDKVQCAYCGGILSKFNVDDDVRYEHRRHFPHCSFVKKDDRLRYGSNLLSDPVISCSQFSHQLDENDLESDGVSTKKEISDDHLDVAVKFPQYRTKEKRSESFKMWPKKYLNLIPKPTDLVDAGLFYTGKDDGTQCYGCGNLLMEWEDGDKPKQEHDKWFPDCPLAGK